MSSVAASGAAPAPESAFERSPREIEVKFRTDRRGLKQAQASPLLGASPPRRAATLTTIYFDTSAGDLAKRGLALRIRKKGRAAAVLGLKSTGATADGPFKRIEIEVRSPDLQPNLALFDRSTALEIERIVGDRPLERRFETVVKRRCALVGQNGASVEVAFDEGRIVAANGSLPVTEVELELKSGNEADLYDLAMRLAGELPLSLDPVSKAAKGLRACGMESPSPVKAEAIVFEPQATLDTAIAAVIFGTLRHFLANLDKLRETDHPESIHQLRVALRRMRSGLAMFNRLVPCAEFDDLRAEAKRIASALGPARECDAFIEAAEHGPLSYAGRPESCTALIADVKARCAKAYGEARAAMEERATTLFVLKVQSLLARRAWRLAPAENNFDMPASEAARLSLAKLSARALKRGKGLPDIPGEAHHRLRIALKNLRYGCEFFASLFGRSGKAKAYMKNIVALQDLLGAHNDAVTARRFLEGFSPSALGAAEFVLGWYAREDSFAEQDLRRAWKTFKRAQPFWS